MKNIVFFCTLLLLAFTVRSQNGYQVVKTYHIKSAGSWDYIAINNQKLYLSHGGQVNILNQQTGDSVGVVLNTKGVHGIAFNNTLGYGYTSNGQTNTVTVFDLKTNQPVKEIPTGGNPDAILFEPYSKNIFTCNGRGKSLSVIDPRSNTVTATIEVGGKPEAAVSDGQGKLFVNIEDKNQIVVIDTKENRVLQHWSLSPGEGPTGLAYDKSTNRLFSSCDKLLVIVNSETGAVVDKVEIGDGTDGVAFDYKRKLIFTSNGEGTISVIREISANKFTMLGEYKTKRGARTIALDQENGELYLPTADFEAPVTGGSRPKMIPGSFQVLVVKASK